MEVPFLLLTWLYRFLSQQIELSEALTGFKKLITTLDQRQLLIQTFQGEVIKHGKTVSRLHWELRETWEDEWLLILLSLYAIRSRFLPRQIIATYDFNTDHSYITISTYTYIQRWLPTCTACTCRLQLAKYLTAATKSKDGYVELVLCCHPHHLCTL